MASSRGRATGASRASPGLGNSAAPRTAAGRGPPIGSAGGDADCERAGSAGCRAPARPSGRCRASARRRGGAGQGVLPGVRITADVVNNTLLIYANQENYRIIERTLRQLDRPQLQVAIEATIAEITLNEKLHYGVQFFLKSSDIGLGRDKGSIVLTPSATPSRRSADQPRPARVQFPARQRSRAAPDPRCAARGHRRQGAVDPVAGGARQPGRHAAGRRPGAGRDRERDRADRHRRAGGQHHRLSQHRRHPARRAAHQCQRQRAARHRAGDQQRRGRPMPTR